MTFMAFRLKTLTGHYFILKFDTGMDNLFVHQLPATISFKVNRDALRVDIFSNISFYFSIPLFLTKYVTVYMSCYVGKINALSYRCDNISKSKWET